MTQEEFENEMLGENGFVRIRKEEGQDQHPTVLEKYLERKAKEEYQNSLKELVGKLSKQLENAIKENDDLRKKLKEEYDFQDWLRQHRTKGQCGGYIVMGISEVIERGATAHAIKTQAALRKLINNPAMSDAVKNVLSDAHILIGSGQFWKQQALRLREKEKK